MIDKLGRLTVVKERKLSEQVNVRVTLRFGTQRPQVDWDSPASRALATLGVRALDDSEAHQYGLVVGETYAEFTRITGTVLGFVTDARCAAGLTESGATEVKTAGVDAAAIFGAPRVELPGQS